MRLNTHTHTVFSIIVTGKWLVSLICKELFKSVRKRQPERKIGKGHEQHFIKQKYKGSEYMERCFQ